MNKLHKTLTQEKWNEISKRDQILNIASEFSRAGHWLDKKDSGKARDCYERAFQLVDLTLNGEKWRDKRQELARFREVLGYLYLKNTQTPLCGFFYNWLIGFSEI